MAEPTFSRSLAYLKELAFGVLAIVGCFVVQCLLLTWIALSTAQINFVQLQARMLRRVYRQTTGSATLTLKTRPIRVEVTPPQTTPPRKAQPVELSGELPSPRIISPTEVPIVRLPPPAATLSPSPVTLHLTNANLPSSKSTLAPPKAALPVPNPDWQTKSLKEREAGVARRYAVKQVDVFTPGKPKQLESFSEPATMLSAAAAPFEAARSGEESVPTSFPPTFAAYPKPTFTPMSIVKSVVQSVPSVERNATVTDFQSLLDGNQAPVDLAKIAKRSAVKIVHKESQQDLPQRRSGFEAETTVTPVKGEAVEQASLEALDNASKKKKATAGSNAVMHEGITPTKLSQLRGRFIETSVLKDPSAGRLQYSLPVVTPPPSPEEVAREALIGAYHERESTRLELNHNYSSGCAEEFMEKAENYKQKRAALAALMPSGQLSVEDEASFPYLSSTDTIEPQVTISLPMKAEQRAPLPSPPTTSEEGYNRRIVREDPGPLITKASRAYQVLLQATRSMEKECLDCTSKFCLNAYSSVGKPKMKSAKDLYQKSRSRLMDAHDGGQLPESLARQFPEINGC